MLGLAIGLGGSFLLTRVLGGLLFEIEPTDPTTLVAVSTLLLVVAAGACFIPARRATLVQPIIALRS